MLPDPRARVNCTDRRRDVLVLGAVPMEVLRAGWSRLAAQVAGRRQEQAAQA